MSTPLHFPERWQSLDTTLCHDWLTGMRGGERVLERLCEGFPRAEILTLLHKRGSVSSRIEEHPIRTSPLQHIPGIHAHYRNFLPTFPAAIHSFTPRSGDLVLSTSHCVAKSLRTQPQTPHLCYCFTPMRYAWLFQDAYFGRQGLRSLMIRPILALLRQWDRRTASRVTRFVGISRAVQQRIHDFYGREADLVYPPVDIGRFSITPDSGRADFDLVVSALVPYKRIDLAIDAYAQLGRPLKVVGIGGELERLRARASDNIEFLEWQPDPVVTDLYATCRHLIFPGEEDFGIVPLEAQACGTPVVAFGRGGALETVVDGETGVYFGDQDVDSLCTAVTRAHDMDWDRSRIRAHAETFDSQNFINGMAQSIEQTVAVSAGTSGGRP